MITATMIKDAHETIHTCWGAAGDKVIEACARVTPFNGTFDEFLKHCVCCGGNWGGMLLTGIKELYPDVWEAIPNDMGPLAFSCLCNTLVLCGVDTTESN